MSDPEFFVLFLERLQDIGLDGPSRAKVYTALLEATDTLGEDAMFNLLGLDSVYDDIFTEYYPQEFEEDEDEDE